MEWYVWSDYIETYVDYSIKTVSLVPKLMRHKVAFSKHVTLLSYIHVPVNVVTKKSGLIYEKFRHSLGQDDATTQQMRPIKWR